MAKVRKRREAIRHFILEKVTQHPNDISKVVADHFQITRQAVNKHLQVLEQENVLRTIGHTRNKSYSLCPIASWNKSYKIDANLAEDVVWRDDIAPVLGALPENVLDIWQYGFTEMFNNAIDHSEGTTIGVNINKTAVGTQVLIADDGIGIFKKIQTVLGLLDERHAVFELHKGKLTTDPRNHTGEGIFFSSRMFDEFNILSGGVYFSHEFGKDEDWVVEKKFRSGTAVFMMLNNHTARTVKKVFDQFASGDDYGFNKTIVPVRLAQYGSDKLISRSQAKRLLARVELFKIVLFDFADVEAIGQAFADEIFRVFSKRHPDIEIHAIKANSAVKRMIERAKSGGAVEI
jgi:anti-sigma regulatory factor (Ser/Thr protein kinase)/biotin operon repressor